MPLRSIAGATLTAGAYPSSTNVVSTVRVREYFSLGILSPGQLNAITDVAAVRVGHTSLQSDSLHTGVTAILPHGRNLYREKPAAASAVLNGLFTTSTRQERQDRPVINGLFRAAVEASEEAILNALFAAETTQGRDGHVMPSLPIPEVLMILRRHGVDIRTAPR